MCQAISCGQDDNILPTADHVPEPIKNLSVNLPDSGEGQDCATIDVSAPCDDGDCTLKFVAHNPSDNTLDTCTAELSFFNRIEFSSTHSDGDYWLSVRRGTQGTEGAVGEGSARRAFDNCKYVMFIENFESRQCPGRASDSEVHSNPFAITVRMPGTGKKNQVKVFD